MFTRTEPYAIAYIPSPTLEVQFHKQVASPVQLENTWGESQVFNVCIYMASHINSQKKFSQKNIFLHISWVKLNLCLKYEAWTAG